MNDPWQSIAEKQAVGICAQRGAPRGPLAQLALSPSWNAAKAVSRVVSSIGTENRRKESRPACLPEIFAFDNRLQSPGRPLLSVK